MSIGSILASGFAMDRYGRKLLFIIGGTLMFTFQACKQRCLLHMLHNASDRSLDTNLCTSPSISTVLCPGRFFTLRVFIRLRTFLAPSHFPTAA
jgi:MFS family permease